MARNGSGTMTPSVDFTTEAASPPIEIAKLDTVLDDIAAEITNSIAADGQTSVTANIPLNGFKLTNVGAPTALTDVVTATTVIDQELTYYVDSGSANTYAITPSPAIAAYEEGQRFVFRAANASTTACTLNVNGLGAIAIQTVDGSALVANSILAGGYYEVTYDANATPDRWVLTSPASRIPDGMLSSNIPLLNVDNTFTTSTDTSAFTHIFRNTNAGASAFAGLNVSNGSANFQVITTGTGATLSGIGISGAPATAGSTIAMSANLPIVFATQNISRFEIGGGGDYDFKAGAVTTSNLSASEVGYKGMPVVVKSADFTFALTDAGKLIVIDNAACNTVTIPANGSIAFPVGTVIGILVGGIADTVSLAITTDTLTMSGSGSTGTRTLAAHAEVYIKKITSTAWYVSGTGMT